MINRVILVGRLTKDPELRYTAGNISVAKFTLAVNRTFTSGANGEKEADFIQCVVWRKQAENLAKFVRKGSLIGVEGRIQTGSYDDKDGIRKYTTEVVCDSVQFLEPKNQDDDSYKEFSRQDYSNDSYPDVDDNNNRNNRRESTPTIDVAEDDLPF
ncbi:MAG: single-stranded DNA-binding protein [Firmicutes bacterium]|nr:single-stranded DNA-binding protein [Bacillota bacterium]